MFGVAKSEHPRLMVKLFSKNSNLCDHNSPTLQTDRQTDRQTTFNRNTALCTKVHRAVKTVLNDVAERFVDVGTEYSCESQKVVFRVVYDCATIQYCIWV